MITRLKNLWKLSGADISTTPDGQLIVEKKPEKRPAIILEDGPDLFPIENPEL